MLLNLTVTSENEGASLRQVVSLALLELLLLLLLLDLLNVASAVHLVLT